MKEEKNMEEQILESATELFLSRGFAGTSTTEIAKHAGCNQALVHYYFRTKDKLFEAIFKSKMTAFLGSFLQPGLEELSFEERMTKKIRDHFDLVAANPKLPLLIFSEVNANPERLALFVNALEATPQQVLRSLDNDLQNEIKAGRVRPMTVYELMLTMLSLNITGFLMEGPIKAITGMSDVDYKKMLERRREENVRIILKGIKP